MRGFCEPTLHSNSHYAYFTFLYLLYLIASRIPPGQGKDLIGKFVNLSMGWWVDGFMGPLGGLGVPLGGQKGAKGRQKEPKFRVNGANREPKGGKNEDNTGPNIDLGSQWGPRAKKGAQGPPPGGPTSVFARPPGRPEKRRGSLRALADAARARGGGHGGQPGAAMRGLEPKGVTE